MWQKLFKLILFCLNELPYVFLRFRCRLWNVWLNLVFLFDSRWTYMLTVRAAGLSDIKACVIVDKLSVRRVWKIIFGVFSRFCQSWSYCRSFLFWSSSVNEWRLDVWCLLCIQRCRFKADLVVMSSAHHLKFKLFRWFSFSFVRSVSPGWAARSCKAQCQRSVWGSPAVFPLGLTPESRRSLIHRVCSSWAPELRNKTSVVLHLMMKRSQVFISGLSCKTQNYCRKDGWGARRRFHRSACSRCCVSVEFGPLSSGLEALTSAVPFHSLTAAGRGQRRKPAGQTEVSPHVALCCSSLCRPTGSFLSVSCVFSLNRYQMWPFFTREGPAAIKGEIKTETRRVVLSYSGLNGLCKGVVQIASSVF